MTYRSGRQVAVHVALGAVVLVGAVVAAFYWLPPLVAGVVAAAGSATVIRAFRDRVARAVHTDPLGVTVVNEEHSVRVAWSEVDDFALLPSAGRRPPRAVLRLRDGVDVPLDGIQGTELQTAGHPEWRRRAIAALNAEVARAHRTQVGGVE